MNPGPSSPVIPAIRAVVRRILDQAVRAAVRLVKGADEEALHDVRVALRRLRVVLRAYGPYLKPGVPGRLRKAIEHLASRTNSARDAEVFVEWLEKRIPRFRISHRKAAEWLLRRTAMSRDAAYRSLRRSVPSALAKLEPLLRRGLACPVPRGKVRRDQTFGQLTARRVASQVDDLLSALSKVKTLDDHEAAHRARIAAKKVRYILEPALRGAETKNLKGLKAFQDAFGEFHDLGGVRPRVVEALQAPDGPGDDMTLCIPPGLARIIALAERERRAIFRQIRREYLGDTPKCLAPIRRWSKQHLDQ